MSEIVHASNSRRALLRQATDDLHRHLDADVSQLDLQRVGDYRNYLYAHAGPLFALESALEAGGIESLFPNWGERCRREALRLDLKSLDARLPAPCTVSTLSEPSAQLGAMYVLEGSRLGAQVLLQRALASTESEIHAACRFLAANDLKLWRSYLHTLETTSLPIDDERMTAAARETFRLFARSFSTLAPARRSLLVPV